jgi:CheY-like chemotaxis protein
MFAEPKRTLLVVDDDASILRVFRRIFERNGYDVTTVETGTEAKEKMEAHGFDAALLDLRLPDMDGAKLLLLMRENPKMVKIVLTGLPYSENVDRALNAGADVFLAKPVHPELLLSVLDRKLKERI